MSFSSLDSLNLAAPGIEKAAQPDGTRAERALRRAAVEFEALLLKQLTSALSPSEDDEDNLFGHGTGDGLYQQMFTEQMALAMARDGGVGLAETILQQLRGGRGLAPEGVNPLAGRESAGAERAVAAARAVRSAVAITSEKTEAAPALAEAPVPTTSTTPLTVAAAPLRAAPTAAPSVAAVKSVKEAAPVAVSSLPSTLPTTFNATSAASATPAHAPAAVALHLPLRGRISSQFGVRRDPLNGGHRRHGGLDIAATRGTPIAAAAGGKVVFAGRRGGYGNMVELEHLDGRRTRYAHADKILVKPGEQVEPGQTVATVGSTGRSTGPHLHFEVRENGTTINPLTAVAKDSSTKRR